MSVSRKRWIILLLTVLACVAVRLFSSNESRVEFTYSQGAYPVISEGLRRLFGWVPFSIGDILYGVLVVFGLYRAFRFFRYIFSKERRIKSRDKWKNALFRTFTFFALLYLVFNLFWGINYNRISVAERLGLGNEEPGRADLEQLNRFLVERVNTAKGRTVGVRKFIGKEQLFAGVVEAYRSAERSYPFLKYRVPSMKPSLWAFFGNAAGFTGYYNPFTGESQVNISGPDFTHPFTALHEAAHAIGYAKESEANFAAYLAATASADPHFRYSAYADLFLYANRSLYAEDSSSARQYRNMLDTAVTADYRARAKFSKEKQSFIEPFIKLVYGKYLQSNSQPAGMLSYDRVTVFLVAFYKKFGRL